jgi:hypothetical protein
MGWLLKDWMGFASELSEVFRVDGALPEVVASITPCRPLKPHPNFATQVSRCRRLVSLT